MSATETLLNPPKQPQQRAQREQLVDVLRKPHAEPDERVRDGCALRHDLQPPAVADRPQIGPQSDATSGLQLRIKPLQNATPAFDVMPSSRTNDGRNGITSVYPKKIRAAEIVMANWFLRHWVIGAERTRSRPSMDLAS